ncbi:HAD family hydrolase [Nocardioides ferulae]|uniref:HAD family hydrolase n=1 Tax=Nocardioides ferulae TaxID=2340821 RepID=UPI000EB58F58|nr:HAD family hydrolase [Nocardioides ferulae]
MSSGATADGARRLARELPDVAVVDIDGTLLDSNYHHTLAWARAFEAVDRPVPLWRLHRHIGMGGDRLVAAATDDETEARLGDRVRDLWKQEFDRMIEETRLAPGARGLLDAFAGAGLRVVLASSSIPEHAARPLRLLDAEERADGWTTSSDAERSKPDPELIEKALEKVRGDRAVMIGDSVWDVAAAEECAIPTVGVLTGGFSAAELREAGAVAVVDDAAELATRLDELLEIVAAGRDEGATSGG